MKHRSIQTKDIKTLRQLAQSYGGVMSSSCRATFIIASENRREALYENARSIGAGVSREDSLLVHGIAVKRIEICIAS